jgi:ubiquinone/menaquinone biosynthesis C-methylase UbiE
VQKEDRFFDFAAEVGLTKHLGGIAATDKLAELCHIEAGKVVLDVGCGAGQTPVYLAKTYGCRVVGVDIVARMIERCEERAESAGVTDLTEFRVADAQDLPFDDDLFDAVITESVTALTEDIQRAVNEFARVTKTGGYVGLNESTWLKTPPPQDIVAWVSQEVSASADPLTAKEWTGVLEYAGMEDIVVQTEAVDVRDEARGILQRYGCLGMVRIYWRMLGLYIKNPAYRSFLKRVRQTGVIPKDITDYFGYGLYAGRKGKNLEDA